MSNETLRASYGKTVELSYDDALARVEAALEREGFGILCRIDVRATLKKKLDVEVPPYQILGACMPRMAHRALSAVPEVGIMLPCNVVVREQADGRTRVEVVDTRTMAQMFTDPTLAEVAQQVGEHLHRVLEAVA
ncbi:MAG: DUF302 domain-containing protein [Candidatus Eiseniibacteriota bacterium]|jgi:uncharacterized protein (DUF302 family)